MTTEREGFDQAADDANPAEDRRSSRRKRPRLGALKPEGVTFGGGYEPVPTHMPRPHEEDGSGKHTERVDEPSEQLSARAVMANESADATKLHPPVNAPKRIKPLHPQSTGGASGEAPNSNTRQGKAEIYGLDETRFVWLRAVPRVDQLAQLESLDERGFAIKDILKLAGKRASAAFEPQGDFAAITDTERLPLAYAFRTSKRVSVDLLEGLHDQADRLRVRSDDAMLRGQFEPLFWREIDRVFNDLKDHGSV
ncbi:hypothetical protein FP2506_00435 [Fulvimarina pelagi HTCC2506]|uniref:Uncharacterized protein n=1 Tax=Fulvimarina pelagi HTCC2506 TaxID=314231 RepID=Q0FXP8_9HYPH|nr:hypothetical protein [Fulvimarina pelagi]EAU39835.1 hypothetical protein FP2506_00435 [Fulvimarina pelagi HTCC2506]